MEPKKNQYLYNNFYVYSYSSLRDGLFYIGKGKNNRISNSHASCPYCYHTIQKHKREKIKVKKEKIFECLSEKKAFAWEQNLIWFFEPKCNLTSGGNGISGFNHSEETKNKISKANKGRPFSESHLANISGENANNAKKTWFEVNEIRRRYQEESSASMSILAKEYGMSPGATQAIIENKNWYDKNYTYIPKKSWKLSANTIQKMIQSRSGSKSWLYGKTGESSPVAKYSWEMINNLRNTYKEKNISISQIARDFEMPVATAASIIKNQTWVNLSYTYKKNNYNKTPSTKTRERISKANKGENHPYSKLTWKKVCEIREKYVPYKYTMLMLAKEYEVSVSCIQGILEYKSWVI